MDHQPGHPGEEAADLHALDVRDGGGPADGGQVALVAVAERRRRAALQPGADGLRRVATLLHGDRRHPGEDVTAADADHVTERQDLGVPGQAEVRLDRDAAGAVLLGARGVRERGRQRGGGDAGGPDHGARRDPLRRAAAVLDRHAGVVDVDDGASQHGRDAKSAQRALGLGRQRRRESGEHAVGGLDEQDAAAAGIGGSEVAGQRVAGELGDLPGHLDAGGTGADDRERQPLAAPLGVFLELGGLERGQDLAAHGQRAFERLHLCRVFAPLVVAEVGVVRAARDDQRVIGHRVRYRQIADRPEDHLAPLEVEAVDLGEQHAHVVVALEHCAQRIGDLAGRQGAGRDLVAERLEQVEVAAVDERDRHVRLAQPERGLEAAEAAADDHDVVGAHSPTRR